VDVPIIVMQGRNDFQVLADIDFALLQELMAGRDDVTFKIYDGLDHHFMTSTATNFVEHRDQMIWRVGARVDEQVLRDIVDWVFGQ